MNGRKHITRAEFVRQLAQRVKDGAKVEVFTETHEKWPKKHNPAQDSANATQEIEFSDTGLREIRNRNTRTLVEGHLVDNSWRRTQDSIRGLPETL